MGKAQRHRGPDDGTETAWGRAGFSFRRLSIIDVAGGRQPISNEDSTCHVVLNGEIYNYPALRADLERRGHRFRTRSDVETVVHGYEEWGDAVLERLRGMFALALWDEPKQRLLLARDRLGKKPLVYWTDGARIGFASELQGLLAWDRVPREIDLDAIHHYLTYQYVPSPQTAFAGVRKLPPGHRLVFDARGVQVEPYWKLRFSPSLVIGEADAAAELRRLLRDAVRVRLMSEVPLGAFLSGGIDSSAVVALMAEFGPVKTFSVGFEEEAFSELPYARQVARRYATDHHEFVIRPHAAEVLPTLVEHYGEPYADSSALPTFYLSRLTRQHVTVALNGDGGDELFAGYDRYRALDLYAILSRLPGSSVARPLARALEGRLPARVFRLLSAVSVRPEWSYGRTICYFTPEQKAAIYSREMAAATAGLDSFVLLAERFAASDAPDLLGRALSADSSTYLPDDLLAKADIACMANSLEGRSPFLDHPLVEFAARLPSRFKMRNLRGKRVLRRAVKDLLPAPLLSRKKMGFAIPVASWLRGELNPLLRDTLLDATAAQRPFFEARAVERLVTEHESGHRDHGNRLWALLMLELWCRRFVDRGGRAAAAD
jgi:asparagine synthase (glutamine-hydrolysing)